MNEYRVEMKIKADTVDDQREAIRNLKASLREWAFLAEVDVERLSVKTIHHLGDTKPSS